MKQKIITDLKFLKRKSEEIPLQGIEPEPCEEIERIIKDLEDSLDLNKGVGLSAIQIGLDVKIAIIRLPNCKINLFNPKIIEKTHPIRFIGEHCLSFPGLSIDTRRYDNITIKNGDGKKYILKGLEAVVAQHEIDHMNGLTILDRKWRKRR